MISPLWSSCLSEIHKYFQDLLSVMQQLVVSAIGIEEGDVF